jgi:hypothetical protein
MRGEVGRVFGLYPCRRLDREGLSQGGVCDRAGFALLAALASSPGGTMGNLVPAAAQMILAFGRID